MKGSLTLQIAYHFRHGALEIGILGWRTCSLQLLDAIAHVGMGDERFCADAAHANTYFDCDPEFYHASIAFKTLFGK